MYFAFYFSANNTLFIQDFNGVRIGDTYTINQGYAFQLSCATSGLVPGWLDSNQNQSMCVYINT